MKELRNKNVKSTQTVEEIRVCCPFCESSGKEADDDFKCYISLKLKIYHCFRCGKSGRLNSPKGSEVARIAGVDIDDLSNTYISDSILDEVLEILGEKKPMVEHIPLEAISAPMMDVDMEYFYLSMRNLTDDEIKYFNIRKGIGAFHHRVVVPIYNTKGEYKFCVGRSTNGAIPKYMYPSGSGKSKFVFNLPQKTQRVVAVCEGVFSAIFSNRVIPSVAILGSSISQDQVRQISLKADTVYLVIESDQALDKRLREGRKLAYQDIKVKIVNLPLNQDPASLEPEAYLYYLKNAVDLEAYPKAAFFAPDKKVKDNDE